MEIKEPIRVICTNSRASIKLIKGVTYFANSMYVAYGGVKRVYLDNFGNYNANNFVLESGDPLESISTFSTIRNQNNLNKDIDYTGQFVRCKWSSGKTLKENEIYYVISQKVTTSSGSYYTQRKLKIRGVRNYVSDYRFEELTKKEQRSVKLRNIAGEKPKTGDLTRKFLLYNEKQKIHIIIEILLRILNDLRGVELSKKLDIYELFIIKGNKYDLQKEDILEVKDLLEKLIEPYNDLISF